jgi:hypothetical protein
VRSQPLGRTVIAVALSVLLLAFGGTWVWGGYSDSGCIDAYQDLPEGSSYHQEAALWPPGGSCVYELPSGEVVARGRPVPWWEWFWLALLGAVAGGLGWLVLRTRSR